MRESRGVLLVALTMCVLLIGAVRICAEQYTITDLGEFRPTAIAGSWVVGVEHNLPMRLNLDTGVKTVLEHFPESGWGGHASTVLPTGEAAGYVGQPVGDRVYQRAAFWDSSGRLTLLRGPGEDPRLGPGLPASQIIGAVHRDSLAGVSDIFDPVSGGVSVRATRWSQQSFEPLGTLGGRNSWAHGVDGFGRLYGNADTAYDFDWPITNRIRAAVWDADGTIHDLGTAGGEYSRINGVNPAGVAIGTSTLTSGWGVAWQPRGWHERSAHAAFRP